MRHKKERNYIASYENNVRRKRDYLDMETRRNSFGKNLTFAASEAYKLLRTNLIFSMSDESVCKIVGVTSALRGEGKSTTSLNLAHALAENGSKTILVEADMRIPVVASVLKIEPAPGLSHILAGLSDINNTIRKTDLSEKLYVLPAGEIPPNPSEMLSSKRMSQIIEMLSDDYDYVIIDLPPINAVSDGLAVSKLLSGMIMVVRQDYCDQHALADAMRQLEFLKVKVLGFVLNGADSQNQRYKYGGKKYKKYRSYYGGYTYSASDSVVKGNLSDAETPSDDN